MLYIYLSIYLSNCLLSIYYLSLYLSSIHLSIYLWIMYIGAALLYNIYTFLFTHTHTHTHTDIGAALIYMYLYFQIYLYIYMYMYRCRFTGCRAKCTILSPALPTPSPRATSFPRLRPCFSSRSCVRKDCGAGSSYMTASRMTRA